MVAPVDIVGVDTGPFVGTAQCPAPTNDVTSAGLVAGYQVMMNNAALFNAHAALDDDAAIGPAGSNAQTFLFGGLVTILSGGLLGVLSGGILSMAVGSYAKLQGRVIKAARTAVADGASKLIGVTGSGLDYSGTVFVMPSSTASAPAVIKWKTTSPNVPEENEVITLLWPTVTTGSAWSIQNSGGGVICAVKSSLTLNPNSMWVELECVSGVARLRRHSGNAEDTTPFQYGVLPGAAA